MACNCYFPGDCDGSCTHPQPRDCEACGGSGEIAFSIWVYEHGCGYGHESSDARPCEECHGTGLIRPPAITVNLARQERIPDDDLPF